MKRVGMICLTLVACTARNPAFRAGEAVDAEEVVGPADAATPKPDAASRPATDASAPPEDTAPTSGLTGFYFDGSAFNTLKFQRVDPLIDFAWANDPPDPSLTFLGFTVRWTGKLRPAYSETYTFTVHSGDGVRLWLDGTLVIDDWKNQAPSDSVGTLALTGGQWHDIKLEYLHNTGWSVVRIQWESASQKKGVITSEYLAPN